MSYGYGPPQFAQSTTTVYPLVNNGTNFNEEYMDKPESHVGIYTPFYITIAVCSVILGSIIILNVICGCSRYSEYWLDRHTGNRWLVSIWTTSPHKQPPMELSEVNIEYVHMPARRHVPTDSFYAEKEALQEYSPQTEPDFLEMGKRESEI